MKNVLLLMGLLAFVLHGCGDEDSTESTQLTGDEPGWNKTCMSDDDCDEDVGLCSKQPGAETGYCSIPCSTTSECPYGEWTCNVIGGCESPAATWCGPSQETQDFAPIVTECM